MDKLEKFINENAAMFDDSEPAEGHFKRFNERLDKEARVIPLRSKRNMIMRVAAAVLILVTGSVIVFNMVFNRLDLGTGKTGIEPGMSGEIRDAMQYYDNQTDNRLKEFNKLACCGEEQIHLNSLVSSELNAIDANISELKKSLQSDPDNERIQAAIIQNQQMKSQVLDNVIVQMKKAQGENRR